MKNKYVKISFAVFAVVVVIVLSALLSAFVIGQGVSGDEIAFRALTEGDVMRIIVSTPESAVAFKKPKAEKKGDTVYITAKKVLVSPLYDDGHFDIEVNIATAEKVVVGEKVIWTKDDVK